MALGQIYIKIIDQHNIIISQIIEDEYVVGAHSVYWDKLVSEQKSKIGIHTYIITYLNTTFLWTGNAIWQYIKFDLNLLIKMVNHFIILYYQW